MKWKIIRVALIVAVVGTVTGLIVLRVSITRSIDGIGATALAATPDAPDRVAALMAFVADGEQPVRERDRAVWALGQLRDPRALPLLRSYLDGGECQHGTSLCQRGLAKAVGLCEDPSPDILRVGTGADG